MSELSPKARELLAKARAASTPTAQDAEVVLAALTASLPAATAATAASFAVAKGTLSTLKLTLTFALAVGTGVLTTAVVGRQLSRSSASGGARGIPGPSPALPSSAPLAELSLPAQKLEGDPRPGQASSPEGAPSIEGSREVPPAEVALAVKARRDDSAGTLMKRENPSVLAQQRTAELARGLAPLERSPSEAEATPPVLSKPPASTPEDPCALSAELSRVRQAQALLPTTPRETVALLEAWQRQCPRGGLIEERLALRALALCAQQAPEAGLSTLLELRTRFPASPSLERVERACTQP